jgi:hypothetical protein
MAEEASAKYPNAAQNTEVLIAVLFYTDFCPQGMFALALLGIVGV